jgi:CysZ protein
VTGAWQVPAGLGFLVRRPRLWPLAALPALAATVLVGAGLLAGALTFPWIEGRLAPAESGLPAALALAAAIGLGLVALVAGAFLGLALALALAAPILERLSQRVEALSGGVAAGPGTGLGREVAEAARGALYLLLRAPAIIALGLVPIVGPVVALAWGAHALAWQETEGPLLRRGLDLAARRRWHRRHRAESLGFGLAGLVVVLVPFANLLLVPVLTVAATRLVVALGGEAAAG